ncbi:MAG: GTP-binding protein [cyanobacterium endosymbiont of Rhopalodia musculus]|uniref:GTP-binding protein n=1 Tax=cyanobacterium endosymbiont of Epithemia clementina EcSB TaxID=3034674 RepID=UPI002480F1BC|nr:GTP-binding protein [cyanobacterium endosymbiont of Epithemia clementina EcSB]WGT68260.1 GTP-binding protein [cyanobacterium endosymbiont of Epithemia clementina EcSB]
MPSSRQEIHLQQAHASLQHALSWYGSFRRHWNRPPDPKLQAAVRKDLQILKGALDKLEQNVIRIATFGLVSRGKSAVINALIGQTLLDTGPLHGVTQWPKSVRWTPPGGKVYVEFIDTPGLDEIEGETRANMAREVAYQADLILFVVAGDITRTEYEALEQLQRSQKPLILVFNKIDLYPYQDCQEIYQQLQAIKIDKKNPILSPEEIVRVAAQPQPILVKVQYPDGKVTEEWETPSPQVEELRQKILTVLNQEGRSLLSLNVLMQAKEAEENIARKTLEIRQKEAETIIWNFTKSKALAVAINPLAFLDIIGGTITDLALIRALARLYGLPITSYEAGKLWKKILVSSGGLLLGELITLFVLGIGKSTFAAVSFFESPAALMTYGSTATMQGGIAGYYAYIVGKAAQEYLEKGCSWSPVGPSTIIQNIISEVDPHTLIYRLREKL